MQTTGTNVLFRFCCSVCVLPVCVGQSCPGRNTAQWLARELNFGVLFAHLILHVPPVTAERGTLWPLLNNKPGVIYTSRNEWRNTVASLA